MFFYWGIKGPEWMEFAAYWVCYERERERDRSYESGHSHSHHWTVLLSLAKCVTFLPCWADNSPQSSDTNTNNSLDTKKKQSLWEVKSSVRQSTMDIWIFVWLLISCCRLSVTGRLAITDSTQSGTIFKSGESFELQCTSNIPWFLCIWDTPGILRSGILITLHCRSDLYFLYSGNEWKSSKADVHLRC